MRIAVRTRVTDKLWSYRCLDGTRIGFSPDSRIIHLPWCRFCIFARWLSRFTKKKNIGDSYEKLGV